MAGPETCDCAVCKAITSIQGLPRDRMLAVFRRVDRATQAVCGAVHRISINAPRQGDRERVTKASEACSRKGTHWTTADLRV